MQARQKKPRKFRFEETDILRSRRTRDILWSWSPISRNGSFELRPGPELKAILDSAQDASAPASTAATPTPRSIAASPIGGWSSNVATPSSLALLPPVHLRNQSGVWEKYLRKQGLRDDTAIKCIASAASENSENPALLEDLLLAAQALADSSSDDDDDDDVILHSGEETLEDFDDEDAKVELRLPAALRTSASTAPPVVSMGPPAPQQPSFRSRGFAVAAAYNVAMAARGRLASVAENAAAAGGRGRSASGPAFLSVPSRGVPNVRITERGHRLPAVGTPMPAGSPLSRSPLPLP